MTAALFLGQYINLTLELGVWVDGTWLSKYLTTLNFLTVNTTKQSTDVITSLCAREQLAEHLDTGYNSGTNLVSNTYDLNSVVEVQLTTLYTAGSNSTTTSDSEYILYWHQERLVSITGRSWDISIDFIHQLQDVLLLLFITLKSLQSGTSNYWNLITRELVAGKQLTNFHLNQFKELRVINLVNLVKEYYHCRNANLTSKQNVLTGLRHWTISCRNYQDCTIHLSSTSDHVLYIVSMARAVNVCIVTSFSLVLNVCSVDGNTTLSLFRSLIDVGVILKLSHTLLRENLGDCCSQSSLTMVNVTDSTNVNMWFCSFKCCLCHFGFFPP